MPSCQSKIAELLVGYPIKSCSVIGHIRQANRGKVCLENTHPFTRELWGKHWTFAHNGQLKAGLKLETGPFQPVGSTDSEMAFCWLLYQAWEKFGNKPKNWTAVYRFWARKGKELMEYGVSNYLLTDGRYTLAFCSNKLHWITRRAPFGVAKLKDADWTIDFAKETTPNDVVSVIATQPLTCDETWNVMQPGEYKLFKLGEVIS